MPHLLFISLDLFKSPGWQDIKKSQFTDNKTEAYRQVKKHAQGYTGRKWWSLVMSWVSQTPCPRLFLGPGTSLFHLVLEGADQGRLASQSRGLPHLPNNKASGPQTGPQYLL